MDRVNVGTPGHCDYGRGTLEHKRNFLALHVMDWVTYPDDVEGHQYYYLNKVTAPFCNIRHVSAWKPDQDVQQSKDLLEKFKAYTVNHGTDLEGIIYWSVSLFYNNTFTKAIRSEISLEDAIFVSVLHTVGYYE